MFNRNIGTLNGSRLSQVSQVPRSALKDESCGVWFESSKEHLLDHAYPDLNFFTQTSKIKSVSSHTLYSFKSKYYYICTALPPSISAIAFISHFTNHPQTYLKHILQLLHLSFFASNTTKHLTHSISGHQTCTYLCNIGDRLTCLSGAFNPCQKSLMQRAFCLKTRTLTL